MSASVAMACDRFHRVLHVACDVDLALGRDVRSFQADSSRQLRCLAVNERTAAGFASSLTTTRRPLPDLLLLCDDKQRVKVNFQLRVWDLGRALLVPTASFVLPRSSRSCSCQRKSEEVRKTLRD
eukprot:766377-Hanusia_phi.AAC.8